MKLGKRIHPVIKRSRAIEKTRRKFEGKPFVFGQSDCVKLARYHLVQMGHAKLPAVPAYSTPLGARKALKEQGVDNLEQLLDKYLPRIAPAEMYPGDVCLVPADDEDGFGETISICLGQKFWGWREGTEGMTVLIIDPVVITKAWRA